MKKRLLSGLLAFAMLFGSAAALPEGVFRESASITASAEVSKATSGKCGENVKWSLKNGVLTISGSGAMYDYSYVYSPIEKRSDITSVVIKSGVTSISGRMFLGCEKIKSISLSNSITSIGERAFEKCRGLTSVTIPKSVKSIGGDAFCMCSSLTNINIPTSVKSIGGMAFNSTKWLKNQREKNDFVVVNGILIDAAKCTGKVIIPNTVKVIGEGAFLWNGRVTSIKIPNRVKRIEEGAFFRCESLKTINIPESVTSIGDAAFKRCIKLTSVTIPNSVKSIGEEAFYGCTSLKSITIPSTVKSIGEAAFGYKTYEIPNAVKKVTGFTIYGAKGTAAEKYAKKNGFKFVARSTTEPKVVRYAGSDRAETATKISKAVNAKTLDTVILATGFDFHDALAAVPLASVYNAPLLLADRDNLSAKTLAEIKRLKAKNVIVVASTNAKDNNGKDAAIRNNVYNQLKGYKVTKITGSSYYETAKNVAKNLKTKTGKNPTSVFITTDKNYADALSASPVAAILGAPILYVDPKANLNATTKNYLVSIKKSVKDVYIVGGVNAVSKDVVSKIKAVLPNKSVTRFDGTDRYETCIKINKAFASTLSGKAVCVAKGYNFPDALAGGVFAAKNKAPLFLADALGAKATISKTQANYLYIQNPSKLYIFGGETAVPTALVKTIAKASV